MRIVSTIIVRSRVRIGATLRRTAVAVLASLSISACTGYRWQRTPPPGTTAIVAEYARVTLAGERTVVVANATIRGDTLHGARDRAGGEPVAIALQDIRELKVRYTKQNATTALVVAGLAAAHVVAIYFALGYPDS